MAHSLCLSDVTLLAFESGRLPHEQLVGVADHLYACPICRDKLQTATRSRIEASLQPSFTNDRAPSEKGSDETQTLGHHAPSAQEFPDAIGPYRLLHKLGEGGMGVVYQAHDPRLKRSVALKMIKSGWSSEEERGRFLSEAKAIAQLTHPNVVQIFDLGDHNGAPYCALELVSGGSLHHRIKNTLPSPQTAAKILIAICRGVQAAHDLKLIHRDLKPANILMSGSVEASLDACVPKVTDFGLVKFLDAEDASGTTRANAIVGTPSYMSPEQAEGRTTEITSSADVWALGAILYEMLVGRSPFKGTTVQQTLKMVIEQEPVSPRRLQPRVPRDLETICLKCLQKNPVRRYASAAALAEDLQRFLDGEPIAARPINPFEKAWRWCKRRPALATLSGITILASVALLGVAFWFTYALADEKRKVDVADALQKLASEKQKSAEDLKHTSEYFARLNLARERISRRDLGWTWAATEDLRLGAAIPTAAHNPVELRTALAACLAGADLRVARIHKGFHSGVLTFHPNGRWLILAEDWIGAAAFRPLQVLIVDVETLVTVRKLSYLQDPWTLISRTDRPRSLAISHDGRWLALGTSGGSLHRWDLDTPASESVSWNPEPGMKRPECNELAFAPDGSALYVAAQFEGTPSEIQNGSIGRWETHNWKRTARYATMGVHGGLLVHPQGRTIFCNETTRIGAVLDAVTLKKEADFPEGSHLFGALSPSGRILASHISGKIVLWDTQHRESAFTFRQPHREYAYEDGLSMLRFSPDGRLLAGSYEHDRNVYLFDVITGERVGVWRAPEGLARIAFDTRSRFLAVAGKHETTLLEIGGQGVHRTLFPQPHAISGVNISSDGVFIGGHVGSPLHRHGARSPRLWRLQNDNSFQLVWSDKDFESAQGSTVFNARNHSFLMVGRNQFRVFDNREKPTQTWLLESERLERATFGPDGRIWMTIDNQVATTRPPHGPQLPNQFLRWTNPLSTFTGIGSMTSLAVGKQWVLAGGADGALRVFPAQFPADAQKLPTPTHRALTDRVSLETAAIAPDDSFAVVGSDGGQGFLIDLPGGEVRASWQAQANAVTASAFLGPRFFVTGGRDHSMKFWSWDGQQVRELWTIPLSGGVTSLGATADGRLLIVTCQGERGVHVWDLEALKERFAQLSIAP